MQIGGLQKTTLIDYPGKIACVVFMIGCNFRCPFCYASELVLPEKIEKQPTISENRFFDFLKERKGLLEGAVLCGGEPTVNKDLPDFVKKIKKMGYSIKLDTNGSNPEMLKLLAEKKLIDYVAMDIKGPKERYGEITGGKAGIKKIDESIGFLLNGNIEYEFRTTVVPGILEKKDFLEISRWISGAKKYYLQNFKPEKTINPEFENIRPYPDKYILEIVRAVSPFFDSCEARI